ncbi:hypothetical protein EIN_055160 [Entamoeba invadens IP1]|uniref:hypothetical protein n=1 Tax=Entamoeba invadens IP1 TaxID=370355 RepID=UPI0002C3E081|nr:hypothetical protein EIN_055160 [Entamoeba invadens IP1]ELP93211.1 hypothetical protein EIN_055160 [Entamoeba invadens IP1]|eukprot:XP_004259982.1 hypothetical protein EIN_055160 [Entamoeba invadens IP1]
MSGRFKVVLDCEIPPTLLSFAKNSIFSAEQTKRGICINAEMATSAEVNNLVKMYSFETIEVNQNSSAVNLSDFHVETIRLKGFIGRMKLSETVKRLEYSEAEKENAEVEETSVFQNDVVFYNNVSFKNKPTFNKTATFYNEVLFTDKVHFGGSSVFEGNVTFNKRVEFEGDVVMKQKAVFVGDVVFGRNVKGNNLEFQEKAEFWVEPNIDNVTYHKYMPDEMFTRKVDHESFEKKKEKKTWWGGKVEDVEKLEKQDEKVENRKHKRRRDWRVELFEESNSESDSDSENDDFQNVLETEDDVFERRKEYERKRLEEQIELTKRQENMLKEMRDSGNVENDLRAHTQLRELKIETTRNEDLSMLIPSTITSLEINGKMRVDGITENKNLKFDVHPISLTLVNCIIPEKIPETVKVIILRMCTGNADVLQTAKIEDLSIQTFNGLTKLSLMDTVTSISLVGIPTLTCVEGCDKLVNLKINMCAKINTFSLTDKLESADVSFSPNVVKMLNSSKIKPKSLKLNNKVIQ